MYFGIYIDVLVYVVEGILFLDEILLSVFFGIGVVVLILKGKWGMVIVEDL